MEEIFSKSLPADKTINFTKILGARVLSPSGLVLGRVSELRLNSGTLRVEGIVVRRNLFSTTYIGRDYVQHVVDEAVILSIEPSILLRNKRVVSQDGKVLGRVRDIVRDGKTNEVKQLVVRRLWHEPFQIAYNEVEKAADSIILKEPYDILRKKNKLVKT